MESKFQTSFIPKKSLDDTGKVKVKTPLNVLFLISVVIISVTIFAAAVAFGYDYLLKQQIVTKSDELKKKEATFPYAKVDEVVRVDNKLKAATQLVGNHTAISPVFNLLEKTTLQNLRFSNFEFTYFSPTRIAISMKGQARTFGAVAKQAELFASTEVKPYFKEPIFSDLDVDENGNVTFNFLAIVDPTLVRYDPKVFSSAPQQVVATSTIKVATSTVSASSTTPR